MVSFLWRLLGHPSTGYNSCFQASRHFYDNPRKPVFCVHFSIVCSLGAPQWAQDSLSLVVLVELQYSQGFLSCIFVVSFQSFFFRASARGRPQPSQNLSIMAIVAPHCSQLVVWGRSTSLVPHLLQKLRSLVRTQSEASHCEFGQLFHCFLLSALCVSLEYLLGLDQVPLEQEDFLFHRSAIETGEYVGLVRFVRPEPHFSSLDFVQNPQDLAPVELPDFVHVCLLGLGC